MCICDKCEHNIVWIKEAQEQKECEFKEPYYNDMVANSLCDMFEDLEEKYVSPSSCYHC